MDVEKFGTFIKEKRKKKNITLARIEELSKADNEKSYLSAQYLSLLENGGIVSPNLEKIKLVGQYYGISHVLVLFFCLTGFENEDTILTNLILEYTKEPVRLDTRVHLLKKDLVQGTSALIKLVNDAGANHSLKELRNKINEFIDNTINAPSLKANDFILQASRHLDNLSYLFTILKMTDEDDFELFQNLEPWFAKLNSKRIVEDRYFITNLEMFEKHYNTFERFVIKYFSYPALRIYVVHEKSLRSSIKKNLVKLISKDFKVTYQKEVKNMFEIIDSDERKISECEEMIKIIKEHGQIPVDITNKNCDVGTYLGSVSY